MIVAALCSSVAFAEVEPAWIEIYTAYATPTGGVYLGRVHKGTPQQPSSEGESHSRGFRRFLHSFDTSPVAYADVSVTIGKKTSQIKTNDRGYFELSCPRELTAPSAQTKIHLADPRYSAVDVELEIPVFAKGPGIGIISDVDDTLLDTGVRSKIDLAHRALHDSSRIQPFDGAAQTLAALTAPPEVRPLFYVSGSPTILYQRISEAFQFNHFPKFPIILKRLSSDSMTDQMAYKFPHLLKLVDSFPERKWILFGDSTEKDPEIYARLMRERPGRYEGVYIHLVTDESPDAKRFRGMRPFRLWAEAKHDLEKRKLMPVTVVPAAEP